MKMPVPRISRSPVRSTSHPASGDRDEAGEREDRDDGGRGGGRDPELLGERGDHREDDAEPDGHGEGDSGEDRHLTRQSAKGGRHPLTGPGEKTHGLDPTTGRVPGPDGWPLRRGGAAGRPIGHDGAVISCGSGVAVGFDLARTAVIAASRALAELTEPPALACVFVRAANPDDVAAALLGWPNAPSVHPTASGARRRTE